MIRISLPKTKDINAGLLREEAQAAIGGRLGCVYLTEDWVHFDVEDEVAGDEQALVAVLEAHDAAGESQAQERERKAEEARGGMTQLPGWATWTAQQAVDHIEANVTDLASAKAVLKGMAKAIVYLRDHTEITR